MTSLCRPHTCSFVFDDLIACLLVMGHCNDAMKYRVTSQSNGNLEASL
jgi:hypothetical protein